MRWWGQAVLHQVRVEQPISLRYRRGAQWTEQEVVASETPYKYVAFL